MSAQWMGFYFDNRDTRLEGSLLLTLLAIADHADSTGAAMGPSRDLIAEKARVTIGQVRRNLRVLEEYGYLQMQRGQGRGKRSFYQLLRPELPRQGLTQKDDTDVTFSEPENDREIKGCMGDTFSENEKGRMGDTFSDDKRVHGRTKKGAPVHTPPTPPYKDNLLNPLEHKPRVRAHARAVSAENFGPPQNLGKKIGDYHFLDFRELLDRAAPHLAGEHLADVRKMWMSGAEPLEVIKCYNTMRMEAWRTHAVTWKTVAGYLPDWQFKKDKGIEPGKENTNYGKPKKIRSAKDYAAAREAWLRKHGVVLDSGSGQGDQPDQPDAIIAGLLNA